MVNVEGPLEILLKQKHAEFKGTKLEKEVMKMIKDTEKKVRWQVSFSWTGIKRSIEYFKSSFEPENKVLVMEFKHPSSPNWRAWAVGINFTIKDIRNPHLLDCNFKWVDPENLLSKEI